VYVGGSLNRYHHLVGSFPRFAAGREGLVPRLTIVPQITFNLHYLHNHAFTHYLYHQEAVSHTHELSTYINHSHNTTRTLE
jgi:hypothetical protein